MSSSSSVVEISRSKSRYIDQDTLLKAFIGCDYFTAKEVAVEVLDWRYEQYANAPKRAFDLQKLGYLEELTGRVCRQTGKTAHTYRITDKGMKHLQDIGALGFAVVPPVAVAAVSGVDGRQALGGLRALLGG